MVQLVELPGGGAGGDADTKPIRDTPQPQPKKPEPPPEPPTAEKPPEPKPENPSPPQPKAPPPKPEMVLPSPKVKEPPKKGPPKREEKKPTPPAPQLAEKKREVPPPMRPTPEPPRQPAPPTKPETERPSRGGGVGSGSGLALGTGGGTLSLDTANFPFTYYLRQVTNRIEENWLHPRENLGRVIVYFRIKRDGTIFEPQIYESSRNQSVDLLAAGAIKRSEPFPPLPIEFGGDYLGIYLCFGIGSACPGQREG
jgi:hypothetical protein